VGGARTALFNYLFARHTGGAFLLRIEDTDRARSSDEMIRAILDAMEWLGLEFDEEVVFQGRGGDRHRADAARLLAEGSAYRCFCTKEELDERRAAARERHEGFRYDGRCRRLSVAESARRAEAGEPWTVRFAVPDGPVAWDDRVHGRTEFPAGSLEDFIILRSDGSPVYNLAVVSDDLHMRITHVIRGDDHLSNTPKQILLYRALGAEPPAFAHVPMILGSDGKRLSKRHGATSVEAYRESGLLPEAMVNFLALLGWSPGDDREVMSMEELIEAFTLERILKKSALFDARKLEWLNGQQLNRKSAADLAALVRSRLAASGRMRPEALEEGALEPVLDLVKTRARTLNELVRQADPFLARELEYDPDAVARHWRDPVETRRKLEAVRTMLAGVEPYDHETLERELRAVAEQLGLSAGKVIHPLRVALTGLAVSPGIFDVLALLGRERAVHLIGAALARLPEPEPAD